MPEKKRTCPYCASAKTTTDTVAYASDELGSDMQGVNKSTAELPVDARHTDRPDDEKKKLMNRLSRIEGQIRGIKGMLEEDAYCPDIMLQVSAVNAALNSFNRVLMENHLHNCVTRDLQAGREDTMDELADVLQKLMK